MQATEHGGTCDIWCRGSAEQSQQVVKVVRLNRSRGGTERRWQRTDDREREVWYGGMLATIIDGPCSTVAIYPMKMEAHTCVYLLRKSDDREGA